MPPIKVKMLDSGSAPEGGEAASAGAAKAVQSRAASR